MRRSEIGLRRAIGATGNSISRQLIGESLLLSTLAILLGCFFAVQFPLLDGIRSAGRCLYFRDLVVRTALFTCWLLCAPCTLESRLLQFILLLHYTKNKLLT
jgi:putative ABC transport system permease protein